MRQPLYTKRCCTAVKIPCTRQNLWSKLGEIVCHVFRMTSVTGRIFSLGDSCIISLLLSILLMDRLSSQEIKQCWVFMPRLRFRFTIFQFINIARYRSVFYFIYCCDGLPGFVCVKLTAPNSQPVGSLFFCCY